MTEPVNVTTESGAAADGDETTPGDEAMSSGHGGPAAPTHGPDDTGGDADLVPEH